MKLKQIQVYVVILMLFSSCNGQEKKQNTIDIEELSIGNSTSELDKSIWKIFQDKKGNYWFGSNGNGIFHYDGKNLIQFTKKDGLVDNTIREIKEDNLGNIFIGTPEGISKFDGTKFTTLKPITPQLNKWELQPNDLWFGYNANDIYRYDGEFLYQLQLPRQNLFASFGTEVSELENFSPYAVFGIDKDRNGNLWIGTFLAGAFRYDGQSFLWIPEKELSILPDGRAPGVRSMLEDKNGDLWLSNFISRYRISTTDSIVNYEKLVGIDKTTSHSQNRISYFNSGVSDNNNDLWMTTYTGGVWKYDGETLLNFQLKDGNTEVLLITIYKDNQGTLWVGTDNAGVFKYNGDTFEKFEL